MNTTLVLFIEAVTEIQQAIRSDALSSDNRNRFTKLELLPERVLPYEHEVYFRAITPRATQPAFASFVDGYFYDVDFEHVNKYPALAVILKTATGRIFAALFGLGANACINLDLIEPRFGLETALSVSDAGLTTVDTRVIDTVSRHTITRLNKGETRLAAFNVHKHRDLVTRIHGRSSGGTIKNASGADSFHGTVSCTIETLPDACDDLLQIFLERRYAQDEEKKRLIGSISSLPRNSVVVRKLNRELNAQLRRGDASRVDFDWPESIRDETNVHAFKVYRGRTSVRLEPGAPDIVSIAEFLSQETDQDVPLSKFNVVGLGERGEPLTATHSLEKCLVAESHLDGSTFLLIFGQWHQADDDYINTMRASIRSLPDLSNELNLPELSQSVREEDYITELALQRGWCVTDQKSWYMSNDQFEHSDLVDIDKRRFICIKKGKASQDLLHLFHQVDNSAKLMRLEPRFRQHVHGLMSQFRPGLEARWAEQGTYVLAIATKKSGDFVDALFLPSLIALGSHIESILSRNFEVAVCRFVLSSRGN